MPHVTHAGVRIWWEEHGEGDPLLLIMGLGATLEWWNRLTPSLTPRYRTIVFDNRGVGKSDVPPGPYSIPLMADDALAVLDAAGVTVRARRRHVDGGLHRAGARAPAPGAGALARARLHQLRRPRGGARGARGRVRDGGAREGAARRRDVGHGAVHLRRVDAARAHRAGSGDAAALGGRQRRLFRAVRRDQGVARRRTIG